MLDKLIEMLDKLIELFFSKNRPDISNVLNKFTVQIIYQNTN